MRHLIRAALMLVAVLALMMIPNSLTAQDDPEWTEPFPPFRIAGDLYYVGSKGVASYLIATPKGHILINSDLEADVPLIRAGIEKLGFKFEDVKILLISHAHFDHCAASATIKELTGAKYMVMDGDVPVVESGGASDFQYGSEPGVRYRPARVERVLHDNDTVRLGDALLVAHRTPGHTKGCTTWTMQVRENGHLYNAVIVGGCGVNPGYKLAGNALYPAIASDYEHTFRVLKSLHCDYFLGAHGSYYDMTEKYERLKEKGASPFIDPEGYRSYVKGKEQQFRAELAKQGPARRKRKHSR